MTTRAPGRPCILCGEEALDRLFEKQSYGIVRCRTCGLVFTHRVPSREELREIYSESFFRVGEKFSGGSGGSGVVNARERVREILELPGVRGERWLDVGCATGDFLSVASTSAEAITGVELSRYAAAAAAQTGVGEVLEADFLEAPWAAERFEIITMWDYIEHVPDPAANARKAFSLLRPGGYLILSTGDVESIASRVMGRFWHLMIPPRHLYFFTPATITRLLERAGFKVVSIRRPGKRVPLDMVLWKATSMLAPRAGRFALALAEALRIGKVAPRLNLYDIMTVTAKRQA